jgi:hypothetical protein
MKISKSPERYTFQKESYIQRCEEEGKEISQAYLKMYDSYKDQHDHKFDTPKSKLNNLEYDLLTTDWILEKTRNSETYAQNLYASMCNRDFVKNDVWPILTEERWSCSWRYAGGIIADMRQEGDYIDWYCSGIKGNPISGDEEEFVDPVLQAKLDSFVGEGHVTDEIRNDLLKLGWIVMDDQDEL